MTQHSGAAPYEVEHLDDDRVIVALSEFLDDPRTEEHATQLQGLVEVARAVAVDATGTITVSSDWLRLLYRLTAIAEQTGKTLGVVGLSAILRESADVLGLRDRLELFATVDEVWEA